MTPIFGSNSRLYMTVLLTAIIVIGFWMTSRYPDLNEKALMGGDIGIAALGFDTVIEVRSDASFPRRVFATTVNWIDTNKQGMAFGLVLAACIMTLLSLFSRRSLNNVLANTALGTLIGAPLGVCVNCVAPIARGMHAAGATLETTLATMLSSPTMNVIVLTMTFTLLPFYMAASKLALTLAFILIGVPLISMFATRVNLTLACPIDRPSSKFSLWKPPDPSDGFADDGLLSAARWLAVTYTRNLWFIVKTTVPLMLGAGFLGALAVTALPWHTLVSALPDVTSSRGILALIAVAIFGVLLPVPIAFDVIIVAVLLAGGFMPSYAMALLFTLGIFSIYSLSIVWTSISRAIAIILTAAFVVIGVGAGYFADAYDKWDREQQRTEILRTMAQLPDLVVAPPPASPGQPFTAVAARLGNHALTYQPVAADIPEGLTIEETPFRPSSTGSAGPLFTRHDGAAFGLFNPANFTLLRSISPNKWGGGIAAGDVHNDGWADVLITGDWTARGLALFANVNGEKFVRQDIDIPTIGQMYVISAALVDLNDDGWLDIVLTSNQDGNFVIYNRNGDFLAENLRALPRRPGDGTVVATAFGDIDRDGDLDAVLGYWTMGVAANHPMSQNLILRRRENQYDVEIPDEILGETLSTLFSDYNNDGALDLIVGNDFSSSPDIYYLGDGKGGLRQVTSQDGLIPHSTNTTMSIATGDLNNDLIPEIFLAQIASGTGTGFGKMTVGIVEACDDLIDGDALAACRAQAEATINARNSIRKRDIRQCLEMSDIVNRQECVVLSILGTARRERSDEFCGLIPARFSFLSRNCYGVGYRPVPAGPEDKKKAIADIKRRNVLLVRQPGGAFEDRAVEAGLAVGGWSWNAKFADVDNDGLKDLYVANGRYPSATWETNLFYRNQGNLNFANDTFESGLADYHATATYSYIDFDNDGDLDIISLPVGGDVRVFVNRTRNGGDGGNAIAVSLRDHAGNRFGIGSKVIIRGGDGGQDTQLVEIQSGGGFRSFDAPVAHFGLGGADSIDTIEVLWSTGERSVLQGPFPAGAHYVVTRAASGGS